MIRNIEPSVEELKKRGGILVLRSANESIWSFGWLQPDLLAESDHPAFSTAAPELRDSGRGRTTLLYRIVKRVWNRDIDHGPQEAQDCVSWAVAGSVDVLACIEVGTGALAHYPFEHRRCTEALYGYSRNEFREPDTIRPPDGSFNRWAVRAAILGGTVSRQSVKQVFPGDDEYEGLRASKWGDQGVPDGFDAEANLHRVHAAARITSFEEARDAIANGYPVCVGSDVGFTFTRDGEGFCERVGHRNHAMKFIGARDDHRPGLLCMNSMGRHTGPPGAIPDIPSDAFWFDADACNAMFDRKDSFVLSGFGNNPAPAPFVDRVAQIAALAG